MIRAQRIRATTALLAGQDRAAVRTSSMRTSPSRGRGRESTTLHWVSSSRTTKGGSCATSVDEGSTPSTPTSERIDSTRISTEPTSVCASRSHSHPNDSVLPGGGTTSGVGATRPLRTSRRSNAVRSPAIANSGYRRSAQAATTPNSSGSGRCNEALAPPRNEHTCAHRSGRTIRGTSAPSAVLSCVRGHHVHRGTPHNGPCAVSASA